MLVATHVVCAWRVAVRRYQRTERRQIEPKNRDPPAGAIIVDSETWRGANYRPTFGWIDNCEASIPVL
jgi:hypothetical protein